MHNFNPADFVALSPAKAKAAALALFTDAHASPAPDWYGVALALHAVVNRAPAKRAKAGDENAMQDSADASEFTAWADYKATGRGILRGRVTVTFADGWSRTLGVLATNSRKPWSIAHAVRFAVTSYKEAACRRVFGGLDIMQQGDHWLDGLFSCPEIVSVVSADSANTAEGDLIWNPCEANGLTADQRAGLVDLATYERGAYGEDCAVSLARAGMVRERRQRNAMISANQAAATRVVDLISPWDRGRDPARVTYCESAFRSIMDADPEGYLYERSTFERTRSPDADKAVTATASVIATENGVGDATAYGRPYSAVSDASRIGLIEDALLAWPERAAVVMEEAAAPAALEEIADAPEPAGEEIADVPAAEPAPVNPRADLDACDHFTMLAATEIVGPAALGNGAALDDWAGTLSPVDYRERFLLVEDALLAWPALVEPCAAIDGEPLAYEVEIEAGIPVSESEPLASLLEPVEAVPLPMVADAPAAPARKPRYSFGADGKWRLVA